MAIVTLAYAKARVKIESNAEDEVLELMLEEASAVVVDYLKLDVNTYDLAYQDESDWTEAPEPVKAAVLMAFSTMERHRDGSEDPLTPGVKSILHRLRDPSIA